MRYQVEITYDTESVPFVPRWRATVRKPNGHPVHWATAYTEHRVQTKADNFIRRRHTAKGKERIYEVDSERLV